MDSNHLPFKGVQLWTSALIQHSHKELKKHVFYVDYSTPPVSDGGYYTM